MNHMSKTRLSKKAPRQSSLQKTPSKTDKKLRDFANSVGDFIRYWGFRRIHGQIWALVYLSNKALSGAGLMRALKVSKALISPALSELLDYKLILNAGGDLKTKLYTANPDISSVIENVLKTREKELLKESQNKLNELTLLNQSELSHLNTKEFQTLFL